MLNKRFMKIVSFVLCFITIGYLFPLEALAYELNESRVDARLLEEEVVTSEPVEYEHQPDVVMEIETSRDEFQKEFLLDNGHRMYVVYPNAVHYEDDGQWHEIDNTLKASTRGADAVYTNTAGSWNVTLPQTIGSDKTIEVSKDGYTLGMTFLGKHTDSSAPGILGNISTSEQDFESFRINSSDAEIQNNTVTFSSDDTQLSQVSSEKLGSAVIYSDIFTDVDLRYDLISNYLKESIIVNTEPASEETYMYMLSGDNMEMVLQDDNSIYVYAEDAAEDDEPIFYLPAPYMTDSAERASFDIEVTLDLTREGYLLTYTPSYEWMSAEERVYPVIIDPVVKPEITIANTADQTVFSIKQLSYTWGMVECGYDTTSGISRTFIMYNNLPTLTSSDMIVSANMALYKLNSSSLYAYINVHQVTDTWDHTTINWSNQPDYVDTIEDFQYVGAAGWYNWDVTDITKGWYSGENTGMMLKADDSVEEARAKNFKQFCSSNWGGPNMPVLTIEYINNNGLEEKWDYTAHSAGRAGTGYINNYTGNLVWVNSGLGFAGNRMPVSINHFYNANDKDTNEFGMGYGWRTNYNQTVKVWDVNNNYLVWDDEDGTKHYFEKSTSTLYKDELGTGNTIKINTSSTDRYTLTFKDESTQVFDANGRLIRITNKQTPNTNVTITYSTGNRISSITDGAGRVYNFIYDGEFLEEIVFVGKGDFEPVSMKYEYNYNDPNESIPATSTIEYPDGKTVTFTWTRETYLLTNVTDIDGYNLTYTYTDGMPSRVESVTAKDGTVVGGKVNIAYANNQTVFTDHDNNSIIYQFNDWGNTVSVQDGQGHAQFAKYATDDPKVDISKANQMEVSSKMQNTVSNLLRNSNFEASGYWTAYSGNASGGTWGYSTNSKYLGTQSMHLDPPANSTDYRVMPTSDSLFTLTPGETYTLSAYVMTYSDDGEVTLAIGTTDGTILAESNVTRSNLIWTRAEVTYTHPSTASSITGVPYLINKSDSSAYFDCVQLEKAAGASRYNIIENGDFIYAGDTSAECYGWIAGPQCDSTEERISVGADDTAAPQLSENVFKFIGEYDQQKRYYQNIPMSGEKGDVYTIAGWAKGDSVPLKSSDRRFGIIVRFYNTDGSQSETLLEFNADAGSDIDWQYAAQRVEAKKNYSSIRILVVYEYNANTVYYDGIQLFKEEFGYLYEYDDKGNVKTSKDLQGQKTTYTYDSKNRLTDVTYPKTSENAPNPTESYEYDENGKVVSATSPDNVKTSFEYDEYGNTTKVTVGENGRTITTTTEYTEDGNYIASVTDARGNVTYYGYDLNTGVLLWEQAPGETDDTRTEYTYDARFRTTAVFEADTSNTYTYTDDLLTQSTSAGGTVYTYNYGLFDLADSNYVGNYEIVRYSYDNESTIPGEIPTWNLTQTDFKNDDFITYTYDDLNRVIGMGYEDNANAVQYKYNNDGDLGVLIDNMNGITTKYYYDTQGRMVGYDENYTADNEQRIGVMSGYDALNNLDSQKITVNGEVYTETYTYDDTNRITKSTSGDISSEYAYDEFNRMYEIVNKDGNSAVVTTSIGYLNPDETKTTNLISTWTNAADTTTTYTYTYDDRGNITSISDGTHTTTYVYDQHDQLIRENNQAANKTWVYTYDGAGNITNKFEYEYTTGALEGTPVTITYEYDENSTWKEQLVSYGGKSVEYDEIGNITKIGNRDYTWEHGRQLASTTEGTTSVSYEYNADGMRLSKTIGSTKTEYYYVGSQLVEMTQGSEKLHFTYDVTGASTVTYGNATYYYLKNSQGDIVGIVDDSGAEVVSYTYDAWGNILSVTGSDASTLGALNPLRYRGYVYDEETNLYYLQSRYYDPEMGRFINADVFTSTGQGTLGSNMYAYCLNNPINLIDSTGLISVKAIKLIISGLIGAVTSAFSAVIDGEDLGSIFWEAAKGFLYGVATELLGDIYIIIAIVEGLKVAFDGIKSGANIAHSIGTGVLTAVYSIGIGHLTGGTSMPDVYKTLSNGLLSLSFACFIDVVSNASADRQGGNDYTEERERQKQLQYEIYYYKGDYVGSWTRYPLLY